MLPNIAFTFITLISAILAVVISLTLFIILILRLKRRKDVPILLAANTYAAMVIFSLVILSENTFVLRIDLYDSASLNSKYWMGCSFLGFFTYERYGCCYMTFVLQALHRLVRVVYTKYKFLQAFSFSFICIIIQWILYFLIVLPSYVWPQPIYAFYSSAYYCGIPFERYIGLCYTVSHIFLLPIVYLSIIYARLLYFIRSESAHIERTRKIRRDQRDLVITRRILFIVISLTLPGLPNIVFVVIANIDPSLSGAYDMYRVQWLGPSVTVFVLSIAVIFINPQIKQILKEFIWGQNRVAPMQTTMREHQQGSMTQPTQT